MSQKAIGQNFGNEIAAAGLAGLPFSWAPDGTLTFGAAMTAAQIAAVEAVYATHNPATADPGQVYAAAIAAGCAIISTATPALNATYAIDAASVGKITAVATGVAAGKGLPGYGATFNLIDNAGVPHAIGAADFLNLAAALENYVYEIAATEASLLGGHGGAWPVQPVTIP